MNVMAVNTVARQGTPAGAMKTIATAWLVAGTMDVSAACTYYPLTAGASPVRILQGIASGLLGPRAFDGGAATAVLGLALHYLIALIWTVIFYVAARRVTALTRHVVAAGLGYGVLVWLIMNLVVLPLSRARLAPLRLGPSIVGAVILMFCIGLPIAAIVRRGERHG
jgi:hypothetical protein